MRPAAESTPRSPIDERGGGRDLLTPGGAAEYAGRH
jgi:hypothetical protein